MIKLFNLDNYEVTVEPEAIMLAPFKALWDRDKNKDKHIAKQELAYVFFMGDPRSDYQYIVDEEVRSSEIIKGLGMPTNWKVDKHVQRALKFYKGFKPISAGFLEDTRYFIDSFRKELRKRSEILEDMEIKDLKDITDLMQKIPKIIKELDEAEKALTRDIQAEAKARGSQQKGMFEDDD